MFQLNQVITLTTGTNFLSNGFTWLLNSLGIYTEEVPSVIIKSDGWDSGVGGSWKVEKSAKWTSSSTAEVTFDVSSLLKQDKYKDILFVLDTSGSMKGERLEKLKSDTIELLDVLLENQNNSVGLVQFSSSTTILSDFTTDKELLIEKINGMEAKGDTNYNGALKIVDSFANSYANAPDTDFIVLFLTDGLPNIGSPNQWSTYHLLKEKHPFVTVNAIQYEMGEYVSEEIKSISDNQFYADVNTLYNVLFEATIATIPYEKFEITDYINDDYFFVEKKDDVDVSIGDVELIDENGKQKIYWSLNETYKIGLEQQMKIKLHLKDEYINKKGFYYTNNGEDIISKQYGGSKISISSSSTPVLTNVYNVIYDTNPPTGCNIKQINTEEYFIYSNVMKKDTELTCPGYIFKGWEIADRDVIYVNDNTFMMPTHNVTIRSVWTKQLISKSMEGTIKEKATFYNLIRDEAKVGTYAAEYTGFDSRTYKHKVYYYKGAVTNNNVLFGGFCWKMVRTTDTGGVKMIYNGVPDANGGCNNTGEASILENSIMFNEDIDSVAYVGYMYNKVYPYSIKRLYDSESVVSKRKVDATYWFADSVNFVSGRYSLVNKYLLGDDFDYSNLVGKYTYLASYNYSSDYVYYIVAVEGDFVYYVSVENGQSLEEANYIYTFGDSYTDNMDGTYTINNAISFERFLFNWPNDYNSFSDIYVCKNAVDNVCDDVWYIMQTTSYAFVYTDIDNEYVYGNSFIYDDNSKKYKLVDTISFLDWYDNYDKLGNYHYTCFNNDGVCTNLKYIYFVAEYDDAYYIELTDGESVEDALNKMLWADDVNTNDSIMKAYIETWFESNLLDYEKFIEDTIYCNDRSIYHYSGWDPNGGDISWDLDFSSSVNRDLFCPNENDRFTKYSRNGNGKLKYPVGLLTSSEVYLALRGGNNNTNYLKAEMGYWLLSPYNTSYDYSRNSFVSWRGELDVSFSPYDKNGVRPVISLKPHAEYLSGDGSIEKPYIVNLEG